MLFSLSVKRGTRRRCLIGAALLLFVFFLSLHSHAYTASNVGKECACVHGSRTQMALAPSPVSLVPVLQISQLVVLEVKTFFHLFVSPHPIRAPPVTRPL